MSEQDEPKVFLNEWSDWRSMVIQNLMRHGNIDKDFARRLAYFYQEMVPKEEQKQGEPVGVVALVDGKKVGVIYDYSVNIDDDLYTTPQQRKPLTVEEAALQLAEAIVRDRDDNAK